MTKVNFKWSSDDDEEGKLTTYELITKAELDKIQEAYKAEHDGSQIPVESLCKIEDKTWANYQELPEDLQKGQLMDNYSGLEPCIDSMFHCSSSCQTTYLKIPTDQIKELEGFDSVEGELEPDMYYEGSTRSMADEFIVKLFKADLKAMHGIEFTDDYGRYVNRSDEYMLNSVVPFYYWFERYESEYLQVTPKGNENPKKEGWYEDGGGTLSEDEIVQSGKQYYTLHRFKVVPRFLNRNFNLVKEYEEKFIPSGGPARTKFGEFLRCCQRVCYRYMNDGDNAIGMDAAQISYCNLDAIIDDISSLVEDESKKEDLNLFWKDYIYYRFAENLPGGPGRVDSYFTELHCSDAYDFKNQFDILCNESDGDAAMHAFALEVALCKWKERDPDIFSEDNDVDSREYLSGEWYARHSSNYDY